MPFKRYTTNGRMDQKWEIEVSSSDSAIKKLCDQIKGT